MLITDSFNNQLDDLLERICEKLQISPTQHQSAKDRYDAVARCLSKEGSPLSDVSIDIYSQGSLRIGTTVRPLKYQEYDLDFVCELGLNWSKSCPIEVLNTVEECLKKNDTYRPMIERKNRCVRLNYANEFHMDILPASPDFHKNGGCVKVPDRNAEEWKDSNPTGYASWFNLKSESFYKSMDERFAASIEPLPAHEPADRKTPLQRSVQLIKRYRDVTFQANPERAPISIVLTTLAGNHYQGQISITESVSCTLQGILSSIPSNGNRLYVRNPTNPYEDLSERWDEKPELYIEFLKWLKDFTAAWDELQATSGIQNVKKILTRMFGESLADTVIREQNEFINEARKEKNLRMVPATGMLTTIAGMRSVEIKKNTFYGK